jgi:AbrB family looped-hinge helix DNA binding protein
MTTTVQLSPRGTLTLPKKLRDKFALTGDAIVILEDTDEGILVRPAAVFPIEIYTDKRLAEFETAEKELGELFKTKAARPAAKKRRS